MKIISTLFWLLLLCVNLSYTMASQNDFELISYKTEDSGVIEASFFEGDQDLVVIFAHGAVFNKESWYFLAERLQKEGIFSLSLDFRGYGNSKKGTTTKQYLDILGAIDYLRDKEFKKVAIVGGSMGGAAVLNALNVRTDAIIDRVVLLAPAGGIGIASGSIKKMFVVSKDEGLFTRMNKIYTESAQPKELKVYPGSTHAQHMFKTEYGNELTNLIVEFLKTSD